MDQIDRQADRQMSMPNRQTGGRIDQSIGQEKVKGSKPDGSRMQYKHRDGQWRKIKVPTGRCTDA